MNITYFGHSCFGIETAEIYILVDPFITQNPLAKHIDINQIKANYILITHAHFDHIADVEIIAKNTNATIVSNYEIAVHFGNKGFKHHPMSQGGKWNFNFGKLKMVNAVHGSSFPDGSYGGQAGGFVIEAEHKNIYIAGDTALTFDMQLIALQTQLDLAILPIGSNFTMDVQDAILASDFLKCDKVLGCHFDTFPYIEINKNQAINLFFNAKKDLMLLEIGQSLSL